MISLSLDSWQKEAGLFLLTIINKYLSIINKNILIIKKRCDIIAMKQKGE